MKVKKELKRKLEKYIDKWRGEEETGGFLLENNRGKISEFIPILNASPNPQRAFQPPTGSLKLAKKYALSRGLSVEAFFHSHPIPSIMSAGDLSASGTVYPDLVFVTISPTSAYYDSDYVWYACKGIEPRKIGFV